MKKFTIPVTAAALVALTAPAGMAASILIDDFTTGPQRVTDVPGMGLSNASEEPGAMLGGYRDMAVTTNGTETDATELRVSPGATLPLPSGGSVTGILSFSNISTASGFGSIVYDGSGTAGLGGINLTGGIGTAIGTLDRFFFNVVSADDDIAIEVDVVDTSLNISTFTETLTTGFDPFLRFSEFAGSADFTQVDKIEFRVASTDIDLDGSLASISVVPLPASALLLIGGLGGFAGLSAANRRRRRKEA